MRRGRGRSQRGRARGWTASAWRAFVRISPSRGLGGGEERAPRPRQAHQGPRPCGRSGCTTAPKPAGSAGVQPPCGRSALLRTQTARFAPLCGAASVSASASARSGLGAVEDGQGRARRPPRPSKRAAHALALGLVRGGAQARRVRQAQQHPAQAGPSPLWCRASCRAGR